jgi:hypothetical protein
MSSMLLVLKSVRNVFGVRAPVPQHCAGVVGQLMYRFQCVAL